MLSNQEIKSTSRAMLIGRYKLLIAAGIAAQLLSVIAGDLFISTGSGRVAILLTSITSLIITLLTIILHAGFYHLYLRIAAGYRVSLGEIFYGFRYQPDKVIQISLFLMILNLVLMVPFILIWFILVRIPLSTIVSVTVWNVTELLGGISISRIVAGVFVLLFWLLCAFLLNLRYSLVFFLYLRRPELSALETLKESSHILTGYKQQLALLILSFLGLELLIILTFGLAGFWVRPYFSMCMTVFFLHLPVEGSVS